MPKTLTIFTGEGDSSTPSRPSNVEWVHNLPYLAIWVFVYLASVVLALLSDLPRNSELEDIFFTVDSDEVDSAGMDDRFLLINGKGK